MSEISSITHNVQPDLKGIVERFKKDKDIGTPKEPLGELPAYFANAQIDEFERNLAPLDNGPLDTDPRPNHVKASSGGDVASYDVEGGVTKIEIDGPGWVGYAERSPEGTLFVQAKSEGNTVTAEAISQGFNIPSFRQTKEYTAKGGFTPPE